jgi:hypothetical protein
MKRTPCTLRQYSPQCPKLRFGFVPKTLAAALAAGSGNDVPRAIEYMTIGAASLGQRRIAGTRA